MPPRSGRQKGRFSPEALTAAKRDRAALELRHAGATYDHIATQLGYANRSGAYKAVERGLETWNPDREFNRILEHDRLDALHAAMWPYLDDHSRCDRVIDLLLEISHIRSKLTGNYTIDLVALAERDHGVSRRLPVGATTPTWTPALELRAEGETFAAIGDHLGITPGAAHKRVRGDLKTWHAMPAQLLRDQAVAAFDELQYALWDAATAADPDLTAVRQVLRIIDKRARLCGLYPKVPRKPARRR